MHVVWFKRDLRVHDHRPLVEAAARGDALCLYVYEPELFATPELGALHLGFINQSLLELRERLRELGADLTIRVGRMPEVLEDLHREYGVTALYSHRETGNRVTYERDLRVARWTAQKGVPWHEWNQFGVIRRLKTRDGWAGRWAKLMSKPVLEPPARVSGRRGVPAEGIRAASDLELEVPPQVDVQQGGEAQARRTLESFLTERGAGYR